MPRQSDPHHELESAEAGSSGSLSVDRDFTGVPDSELGDEVHLSDYARVFYRRRWIAATIFLVVVLAVTVYTFTATPIYEARGKLLIESDAPNFVDFRQVVEEGQLLAFYYQTQFNILQSRGLARKTLDAIQLWEHPQFAGEDEDDQSFSVRRTLSRPITAIASLVAEFLGLGGATVSGVPEDEESVAQSRAIDRFLRDLEVLPVQNSRIVDLVFRAPDPRLAASVVNTLASAYIAQNLEFKFGQSIEASDWLGERLAEQRQQVEQSEVALQRYREQNDGVSLDERQDIVRQKLTDLNAAVTRARTERMEKEASYNQLRAIQDDPEALHTFPAIFTNGFIQQQKGELATLQRAEAQLTENLGDRHPDLIKARSAIQNTEIMIEAEIANVIRSVGAELSTAKAQEQSLVEALDVQTGEALSLGRMGIDYGVLSREAESNRELYQSLLQRANETGISGELRTTNIRVLDAAEVPLGPVSPRVAFNLWLGIFGGGMLAVGFAFFVEYLDDRMKTPDEVQRQLGLTVLGMVPMIAQRELGVSRPMLSEDLPAHFSEAFNSVRTNVLFSSADEHRRTVIVTSTGPGEGKTIVSSNLAMSLAQTGQRVLLVDGDLRRPVVHELFGMNKEPGLSNLLVGRGTAKDTIEETLVEGLWVMTSGKEPPDPAALLGSQRFKNLLADFQDHFDWVIIDSAPVMAVVDAAVMTHEVSGIVFVVGADMTRRRVAQIAIEQLKKAGGRFIGVVLNRADLHNHPYYYSQYYHREYSKYYQGHKSA